MKNLPRIFVSIASYRDLECQHTVQDLFEKAQYPQRIFVGICWQVDPAADADCFAVKVEHPLQVRELRYHSNKSKGGCWARAEAHSLLQDEDYVLQIDAHMRFAQNWDTLLLDTLATCSGDKAALSGSCYGYTPPDRLDKSDPDKRRLIAVHALGDADDPQLIHMGNILWPQKDVPTGLMPSAFFVGNFLFIPAQAIRDIPYDPHIYFRGQEPAYAARLWTHGWNIFQPEMPILYHYWQHKARGAGGYKDMNEKAQLGKQRVQHLLMGKDAPPEALTEIEKYGMGQMRRLEDFWKFAGIDLKNRTINPLANRGRWDKIST